MSIRIVSSLLFLLVASFLLVSPTSAGPNEGGTLILHACSGICFSEVDFNCAGGEIYFCDRMDLANCEDALVTVPTEPATIFWAVAAFPEASSPRLSQVSFGLDYGPEMLVIRGCYCADSEVATTGWPLPGQGTVVNWNTAQTSSLVTVYFFAAYAYPGPGDVRLIPHPTEGAYFSDDAGPPNLDPIADLGRLGFGMDGYLPCPADGVPAEQTTWGWLKALYR